MGFDQYHEPPEELPERTRTFARLCASLTEEAEAETLENGGGDGDAPASGLDGDGGGGALPSGDGSLGIGSLKSAG